MTSDTKTKKVRIKVGDTIRVDAPHVFIRCGYPKTFESETAIVEQECKEDIEKFLRSQKIVPESLSARSPHNEAFSKIARALAYARIKRDGFGGRERSIYTQNLPEFTGKEFRVERVFHVKTGVYVAGSGHYFCGGSGEYDYDPPYLDKMVSHRILELNYILWPFEPHMKVANLCIEDKHVTRL